MDSILQKLYHGMIHPEEEYQPAEACAAERKDLAQRQAELLKKLSTIDSKACCDLEGWFEWENAADAMELEAVYIQGMRMGARLVLALLEKEDI